MWILGLSTLTPPVQGFVVAWNRRAYRWSALVVYVEPIGELEQLVQRWLSADRLRPVRSDPNRVLQYWRFGEAHRPDRPA